MASIVIHYKSISTSQIGLPKQTGRKVNVFKTTKDKETFRDQIQVANKHFDLIYDDFIYLPVGHLDEK